MHLARCFLAAAACLLPFCAAQAQTTLRILSAFPTGRNFRIINARRFGGILSVLSAALALVVPMTAWPQAWPTKPIHMIVPFPPGGGADLVARLLASRMSDAFAQPVLVENRSGGGSTIGAALVARALPDGYTLLAASSSYVTGMFVMKNFPYDPVKDFTPITAAVEIWDCIVVHPSVPANNLKELINYSIRNPRKLSYGTPGIGTSYHIVGELINQTTGVTLVHVPYKGIPPAISDLVGGQIPVVISSLSSVLPHVRAGKIRMLAVLQPKRYAEMPNVPSINETIPDFPGTAGWFGFLGPANLPQPVLSRLNVEMVKALNAPDVRSKLEEGALMVIAGSPEQFAAIIKAKIDLYAKIVKAIGIQPQ